MIQAGLERDAIFASKEYHLPAIQIIFSCHGDNSFPLMEIISVIRGDEPSDPWKKMEAVPIGIASFTTK